MQLKDLFFAETERKRFRHSTFSPAVSVMGEAAESIWRRVNIVIVESTLHFTTIVHGSFMFSFKKKALLPWNFKCRGDKMLVAYWRPVLKFWSPTLNLWSHWRPVSRNFGPWFSSQVANVERGLGNTACICCGLNLSLV